MIKVGTYIGTGSNDVLPEIIWRDQTQQQWIDKAVEQYRLHGVSVVGLQGPDSAHPSSSAGLPKRAKSASEARVG